MAISATKRDQLLIGARLVSIEDITNAMQRGKVPCPKALPVISENISEQQFRV